MIVFAFGFAPVGGAAAEVPEAAEFGGGGGGAGDDAVFDGLEVRGKLGGPEVGAGVGFWVGAGIEFTHPELFGAVVGDVVVLPCALEAFGGSEEGPPLGFVAGAAEELAVDEAFHE